MGRKRDKLLWVKTFVWVGSGFIFFLLTAFAFTNASSSSESFLAKIEKGDEHFLQSKGYELENLKLKAFPGYYKLKRKNVSALNVFLYETLGSKIKDKQENRKVKVLTDDTEYASQWNIPKIKADQAWDAGALGSSQLTVAILDTGMGLGLTASSPVHEEFSGRIWTNDDSSGGGDSDGNGFIDDTYGWDFVSEDRNSAPDDGGSANGNFAHGTLVAGVIAANSSNSQGIAGLDRNAKIMPVRVMDNDGVGNIDDLIQGIEYATNNGAKVINMSLGLSDPVPLLEAMINYSHDAGTVLIGASGNDNSDVIYPAAYENVIAVGATDQNDTRATFSNFGPELDVVAPGVTIPTTAISWQGGVYTTDTYATASGTSLSAPHVAALASLLLSQDDGLSPDQILAKLKRWAAKVPGMGGNDFSNLYGYGRIDVFATFESPRLILGPDNNVYFIEDDNTKRWITGPSVLNNWGFSWAEITPLSGDAFNSLSTGPNLTRLIHEVSSGKVYYVENGQKRWVRTGAMNLYGLSWAQVQNSSPATIALLSAGSDLNKPSLIFDGTTVYYIDGSVKRWVLGDDVFNHWGFSWGSVATPYSRSGIQNYPVGQPLTRLVQNNGAVYRVQSNKFRYVNGGKAFQFHSLNWADLVNISDSLLASKERGTNLIMPTLVMKSTGGKVYLIENNKKRWINGMNIFDSWALRWSDIYTTTNYSFLDNFPSGDLLTRLVHNPETGEIFYIENGTKRWISGIAAFNANGFSWSDVYNVSPALLSALPSGPNMNQ